MAIPKNVVDPRRGMPLDKTEMRTLVDAGVRAQPRVTEDSSSGTYMLVGDESGGCAHEVGHYVAFVPLVNQPFLSARKVPILSRNSFHRRIIAKTMVRVEIFRYLENHVHVWFTLHHVNSDTDKGGKSPKVGHYFMFRERFGSVDENGMATFMSLNGGPDKEIPEFLRGAFRAALAGSRCRGCKCSTHMQNVAPIVLPEQFALMITGKRTESQSQPKRPVPINTLNEQAAPASNVVVASKEKLTRATLAAGGD
jgi:hypothetical protein